MQIKRFKKRIRRRWFLWPTYVENGQETVFVWMEPHTVEEEYQIYNTRGGWITGKWEITKLID